MSGDNKNGFLEGVSNFFNGLFSPVDPREVEEARLEAARTRSYNTLVGVNNQLDALDRDIQTLKVAMAATPENQKDEMRRLYQKILEKNQQYQVLNNQKVILETSQKNLNAAKTTANLANIIHESNTLSTSILQDSTKTMGVSVDRVMSDLKKTNQKIDSMNTAIGTAALDFEREPMLRATAASTDIDSEIAAFRQDLMNTAVSFKRDMTLQAMPSVPLNTPVPVPVPAAPTVSMQHQPQAVVEQDPWLVFMGGGNTNSKH